MGKKDNRRKRNREYLDDVKSRSRCIRCGTKDNLTFHHLDPKTKSFGLSEAPRLKVSMANLKVEISKCVVLCEDCHKLEHEEIVRPPAGDVKDFISRTDWCRLNYTKKPWSEEIHIEITYIPLNITFTEFNRYSRRVAHDIIMAKLMPFVLQKGQKSCRVE